ncbi:hypothetical protein P7C71_g5678, partial [Lecanoromycetidae sp. Uapishka_2]
MDPKQTLSDAGNGSFPSLLNFSTGVNLPFTGMFPGGSGNSSTNTPSSMTMNFNDILMMACQDAITERDLATARVEKASREAASNKVELDALQMALTASKLELQHQAETVALATAQTENASREAASAKAELSSVQMELQTCKLESQQHTSTMASVTLRLENADKEAASAKAENETLRTQIEALKQVQQQQSNAIQSMTEEAKRYGTELLQTRSSLETSRLDIGQKLAMIEQLNRDRDVERNAARQERERQGVALQNSSEEARRAQNELQQARQAVDGLKRELDQKNDQVNQIMRRMQDGSSNPLKMFGW